MMDDKEKLVKIQEEITEAKDNLGQRSPLFILYGVCTLLFIFLFVFGYRPLVKKLDHSDQRLRDLKEQLSAEQDKAVIVKKLSFKGKLMPQKEAALAIDAITEKGKELGLKFIAITPQQKRTEGDLQLLPITFQIESTYNNLGEFLLYLEDFGRTLAAVEDLSISVGEGILPKLKAMLLVNLYMEH